MALELLGGFALEAVFGEFRSAVLEAKGNAKMLKPKMKELEGTLEVLYPVIQDIEELNKRLNGTQACERETKSIKKVMEDGKKLVSKCSKIGRWNLLKRSRYKEKLTQLDNSLLRFHSIHMQAHMARDVKCSLLALQKVCFTLNISSPQCFTLDKSLEKRNNQLNFYVALVRVQKALLQFIETGGPTGFKVVTEDRVDVVEQYFEDDDKFKREEWFKIRRRLNRVTEVLHDINSRIQSRNSVAHSQRSDQNKLRISEYDETKENESCEGVNPTHNIELLALPPLLPSHHETSEGDYNSSSNINNGIEKHENESQKPLLHILEATAAKLNVLSPAIIVLLCCFNLVMNFLIFMFK